MTDLDPAAQRAADELARRLRRVVPQSLLADPDAWAAAAVRWLQDNGWRHMDRTPDRALPGSGTPPPSEYLAARAALTRQDT